MQITGWSLTEIDDAPADLLDWLLRIDVTVKEVEAEAKAKANRRR